MPQNKRKKASCCKSTFSFLSSAQTYDEKSLKKVETILLYKVRAFLAARLILTLVGIFSKSYFIRKARLLKDNNFADVDLEFQEAVLPVVYIVHSLCRLAQLVLLILTFKWPKLARAIYATDLLTLAVWSLVPNYDVAQHVNLTYYFLLV